MTHFSTLALVAASLTLLPLKALSAGTTAITQANIQAAVNLWIQNKTEGIKKYGNISKWDTSSVTDMSYLFYNYFLLYGIDTSAFNDPIGAWKTSRVTNMSYMFGGAIRIQSTRWGMGHVSRHRHGFSDASAFNQTMEHGIRLESPYMYVCSTMPPRLINPSEHGIRLKSHMGGMFYYACSKSRI